MSVYTQDFTGDWQTWIKKPENKDLPILEAKQKFVKEQLLFEQQYANYMAQVDAKNRFLNANSYLHQGGQHGLANDIIDVRLSTLDLIVGPNPGTVVSATASFENPIRIVAQGGGYPAIQLTTNFAGGGLKQNAPGATERISPFEIGFEGINSEGTEIYFKSLAIPGIPSNDINEPTLANALTSGSVDFGNATAGSATGLTGGSSGLLVLTYSGSHGAPAGKTGVNVSASYLVNGGGTDFVNVIVSTPQSSSVNYNAGDVFSLDTSTQGVGGTGTLTWTLGTDDLTGVTCTFGSGETLFIQLGGTAQIENADGEGFPSLDYTVNTGGGNKTRIALAASSSTYTD